MDISLVVIDFDNKTLEFAGAKNPLIYVQNGEVHTIRGNRVPIGGEQMEITRIFDKHTRSFADSPIMLYLFSDGFQDQFGGPKDRKFMLKNLHEQLYQLYKKPVREQHDLLAKTFDKWKGDGHQIDDVILLGVRLE